MKQKETEIEFLDRVEKAVQRVTDIPRGLCKEEAIAGVLRMIYARASELNGSRKVGRR